MISEKHLCGECKYSVVLPVASDLSAYECCCKQKNKAVNRDGVFTECFLLNYSKHKKAKKFTSIVDYKGKDYPDAERIRDMVMKK